MARWDGEEGDMKAQHIDALLIAVALAAVVYDLCK